MGILEDFVLQLSSPPEYRWRRISESKNGKERVIGNPNDAMRELHKRLIVQLRGTRRISFENTFGGLSGSSTLKNALEHHQNIYFYILDIRDAYRSVSISKLAMILEYMQPKLGTMEEIESFLVKYCSYPDGGLVIGAPASQLLFNMYCAKLLDPYINLVVSGMVYTRYIDDLVISSKGPIASSVRKSIRLGVERVGFEVNHGKSKLHNLKQGPVTITGIKILPSGSVTLPSESMAKAWLALKDGASKEHVSGMAGQVLSLPHDKVSMDMRELQSLFRGRVGKNRSGFGKVHQPRSLYEVEFIDRLKHEVNMAGVIGRRVKLSKRGREFIGLCPKHNEKTPSFTIAPDKGFFHCFGCGWHGDIIAFLKETSGLSFREAIAELQDSTGIYR